MENVFIYLDTLNAVDRALYWSNKPEDGAVPYVRADIHQATLNELEELQAEVADALPAGFTNVRRYIDHLKATAEADKTNAHLARQIAKQNADEVERIKKTFERRIDLLETALKSHKEALTKCKFDNEQLRNTAADNL